jgi:SAM-dependent methyltransferase
MLANNVSRRYLHFVCFVAVVLLMGGALHQWHAASREEGAESSWSWKKVKNVVFKASPYRERLGFKEIGLKYGTDKVTDHSYYNMYDKYFQSMRGERVKFLEIGLGCDMAYGPGASYYTWLDYFDNIDLYYIEAHLECAAKWASRTDKAQIFAGDQANVTFLQEFIDASMSDGIPFDIIVDDGGHHMTQQRITFEHLWHIVRPGGYYIIEDLHTSYIGGWGGDPSRKDPSVPTMTKYIYEMIDDIMTDSATAHQYSAEIRSIDCMRQICNFVKKVDDTL